MKSEPGAIATGFRDGLQNTWAIFSVDGFGLMLYVILIILVVVAVVAVVAVVRVFNHEDDKEERRVRRILGSLDGNNPQWTFCASDDASVAGYEWQSSWGAKATAETEDGRFWVSLTEEARSSGDSTHHSASVYVSINGVELLNVKSYNGKTILFISSCIAATAGMGTPDPSTMCNAFVAQRSAEKRREEQIRRKYTR